MRDFINYLENENIIKSLKEYYRNGLFSPNAECFLKRIIERLKVLKTSTESKKNRMSLDLNQQKFDIISNLYGKTRDYKEKKKLGEFYT
ncbi:MAG: hypothetical protein ACFE75_06045, partial [Candidatus Hodarchaeota archaeon]